MRLIDADSLKAKFPFFFEGTVSLEKVAQNIDNAPTIDPVKHGRWVHSEYAGIDYYQCNLCGKSVRHTAENYCPNCGARMDGDDNEID